jgi:hypothetical protein
VTDAVSPAAIVAVDADNVNVSDDAVGAALDGPEATSPSPNAVTTTSAIRLKVNFVILFLSSVVKKTIFLTAGKDLIFAS